MCTHIIGCEWYLECRAKSRWPGNDPKDRPDCPGCGKPAEFWIGRGGERLMVPKTLNGQAMPMLAISRPVRARAARPGGRALGGLGRVWAGADCLLKKLGPYKIVRLQVGDGV